jgi:hypothetical protein
VLLDVRLLQSRRLRRFPLRSVNEYSAEFLGIDDHFVDGWAAYAQELGGLADVAARSHQGFHHRLALGLVPRLAQRYHVGAHSTVSMLRSRASMSLPLAMMTVTGEDDHLGLGRRVHDLVERLQAFLDGIPVNRLVVL